MGKRYPLGRMISSGTTTETGGQGTSRQSNHGPGGEEGEIPNGKKLIDHRDHCIPKAIVGQIPVPDDLGRIRLKCPCRSRPEHAIVMTLSTGDWYCESGCGRGDIADYEEWRSKAFGIRQGENNIRGIIEEAKSRARPAQVEVPKDLDPDARSLFARITRHPGKSRRNLQQTAHLRGKDFHRALRLLDGRRLVSWEDEPSTGGRRRRTYFPGAHPPTMTPQDRSMVGTQRRTHG